jgi:hypothetical protein
MTKKLGIRSAVVSALIAAWGTSGPALAIGEVEPDNPVGSAQHLVIGSGGTVQVTGVIGVASGPMISDVDFYSFQGRQGDVITVDIDGGMNPDGTGVDTVIAIFGPNGTNPLFLWRQNDDGGSLDAGSSSVADSRIDNFSLPATGTYVVGVSSYPGTFIDVNTLATGRLEGNSNGAYTLIISGVTPSIQQVNIDIKPGHDEVTPINPQARGAIPVALLSSPSFDALQADRTSLRFGETGDEDSLVRCERHRRDVNHDGLPDLVCYFDNRKAGFEIGDTEGILKGTAAGGEFEGRGWLKVVAGKRRNWDHWFRRHARDDGHDGHARDDGHDRNDRHD